MLTSTDHVLRRHRPRVWRAAAAVGIASALSLAAAGAAAASPGAGSFPRHHHHFHHGHSHAFLTQFSTATQIASTVPSNLDVNPYGIALVTHSDGALVRGDTLVSNFNASSNVQGTGTTIVEVSPTGTVTTFAALSGSLPGTCPGGVGLTTALSILSNDYVVVGSLPTDSTGAPQQGCLIVVNPNGQAVAVWSSPDINGPWDMTSASFGPFNDLFVTNVLNGTVASAPTPGGTVLRLRILARPHRTPIVLDSTVIANGFDEQLNTAALVIGPTGVALSGDDLYVADTLNNRIAVIPHALWRHGAFPVGGGLTVSVGGSLNGPLGLLAVPNGDLVAVNSGDGNAVEVTPDGHQIATVQIDPLKAGGDLFGLTLAPHDDGILFVDDGNNTLQLFH